MPSKGLSSWREGKEVAWNVEGKGGVSAWELCLG